jgi:hypothetical protein
VQGCPVWEEERLGLKRLYGIDVLSIPEGSALLPTLLDGLAITRAFTRRGLVEVRL